VAAAAALFDVLVRDVVAELLVEVGVEVLLGVAVVAVRDEVDVVARRGVLDGVRGVRKDERAVLAVVGLLQVGRPLLSWTRSVTGSTSSWETAVIPDSWRRAAKGNWPNMFAYSVPDSSQSNWLFSSTRRWCLMTVASSSGPMRRACSAKSVVALTSTPSAVFSR